MAEFTDLQMLRALLALPPGQLKQKQAFQAMYDSLAVGGQVSLSKKQRLWVAQVFDQHKLKNKPIPKEVKTLDPGKKDFDIGPLPKRPPGR